MNIEAAKRFINTYRKDHPFVFYFLLIYIGSIISYIIIFVLLYADRSQPMALNEVGDFLAGAFSPIAFLFLYLGYRQNSEALNIQAEELKQSNEALKLQANELQNLVNEQRRLSQIYLDEKEAKHFSLKPYLDFKGCTLNIEEFSIAANETHSGQIDNFATGTVSFYIVNNGGTSKQLSYYFENSQYINQLTNELKTDEQIQVNIPLMTEEVDNLFYHHIEFSFNIIIEYHDSLGRKFCTKLNFNCFSSLFDDGFDVLPKVINTQPH